MSAKVEVVAFHALPLEPRDAEAIVAARRDRRPRWDFFVALAVILSPVVALVAVVAERGRIEDVEQRFVLEANARFARRYLHPVLGGASSTGEPEDELARRLVRIARAAKALGKDETLARARNVVSGEASIAVLPASVGPALAAVDADLDAVLVAARAEQVDFPDSLDAIGNDDWILAGQSAVTLAGVRMRTALAAGESHRALSDGLDALALGRHASTSRGLVGHMMTASTATRLLPALTDSLSAATQADRRAAVARLRSISAALPPFSRTLADNLIDGQLILMGDLLSSGARTALDPHAWALVSREGLHDNPWWVRVLLRDGWRDLRNAQAALVAAADLPDPERSAAWKALDARLLRLSNPISYAALIDYSKFARRADAVVRRMDALVLAAAAGAFRDARGRWPESVTDLASAGEISADEAARLRGTQLEAEPQGNALSVMVPLPRIDPKEPTDLRFVLRQAPTARPASRRPRSAQSTGPGRG